MLLDWAAISVSEMPRVHSTHSPPHSRPPCLAAAFIASPPPLRLDGVHVCQQHDTLQSVTPPTERSPPPQQSPSNLSRHAPPPHPPPSPLCRHHQPPQPDSEMDRLATPPPPGCFTSLLRFVGGGAGRSKIRGSCPGKRRAESRAESAAEGRRELGQSTA